LKLNIEQPICGRGCVKTQIQKHKVGNQNRFTDFLLNMWGL
jgi:hypothetical protein